MRFHCVGLAHTITHKDYVACAFTQKVLKFCAMMSRRGHVIYHYGHERSEVECFEHITVTTDAMLKGAYGDYNFNVEFFKYDTNDGLHKQQAVNCIREITSRGQKGDFVLCFFDQKEIGLHFVNSGMFVVHPGIGSHNPVWAPFNVFESYAVMNNTFGFEDPRFYNVVIPNYFDPADFDYSKEKKGYLLLLGRLISKKGIHLAQDLAYRTGHILIVAGQGTYKDATGVEIPPPHVKCIGYANAKQRRLLLSGAKALIQATYYSEPFGGTTVEAAFSGTPVITTDWGAFPEIVVHGVTGFRCRQMEHFEWAVHNIHLIQPEACRLWATKNFTFGRIAERYEEYFHMVSNLHKAGLYEPYPERQDLSWLSMYYPCVNCEVEVLPERKDQENCSQAIEELLENFTRLKVDKKYPEERKIPNEVDTQPQQITVSTPKRTPPPPPPLSASLLNENCLNKQQKEENLKNTTIVPDTQQPMLKPKRTPPPPPPISSSLK